MTDVHFESFSETTRIHDLPDSGRTVPDKNRRHIVPSALRGQFLGERWIAGRACVVQPYVLSTALLVDVSFPTLDCEFSARYCYERPEQALDALRDWNGRLDPPGAWLREEITARVGPGVLEGHLSGCYGWRGR